MLGSAIPATATATLQTSTSSAHPTSPTRPSRLRGLTYLRNYAHDHLHSRNPASEQASQNPLTRSRSSPCAATPETVPPLPSPREPALDLSREGATAIRNGTDGWLPAVQGHSGLGRDSLQPASTSESASPGQSMTRNRTASASAGPTPTLTSDRNSSIRRQSSMPDDASSQTTTTPANTTQASSKQQEQMPTIRFIPHTEARSRPSLHFAAVARTLATPTSVVRVGRYSERDNPAAPTSTSTTPVGFKSKVVSRRHCEFWCSQGQWYVKDVKSSSGTFLNHVRLSPPGSESPPYPVNDGDVVQLGIDFKGGEEVIFRCVKIRIECNRGWQKSLNSFNTSAHQRLFKKGKGAKAGRESDAASVNTSECSICLNPVAPCQALFVAPCSHVWHFKCIKKVVDGPAYPNFICPNCRFVADLEAEVEPPEDFTDGFAELDVNDGDESPVRSGLEQDGDDASEHMAQENASNDDDVDEDGSNDEVTRRMPSRHEDDDDDDEPIHRPPNSQHTEPVTSPQTPTFDTPPPTLRPVPRPSKLPNRPNPFLDLSPNSEGDDTVRFSGSSLTSHATSQPLAISANERRRSAPWRSESSVSLDEMTGQEQARSPTPTSTTAFVLGSTYEEVAVVGPLERGEPENAPVSLGG